MYIVPIAWMYVVVLMSLAEATSSNGSLLGAFFTFVLYGVLPLSVVMYLMGTPLRWRTLKKQQQAERQAASLDSASHGSATPDGGGEAPADTITPVREKH
jgi:membrane protein implicated in regulation of membrane protease activity